MATRAALGFKLHTGWAMMVVIAGQPGQIEVMLRSRVDLLPPGGPVPRFVYHMAAERSLPQAQALVKRAQKSALSSR